MAIELTTADTNTIQEIKNALQIVTLKEVFPEAIYSFNASTGAVGIPNPQFAGTKVNFVPLQNFSQISITFGTGTNAPLSAFEGADKLENLEDRGTSSALNLFDLKFSATTLNQLFSALPATTKTATINVRLNTGAATCDTSIATNKGYTVLT